jgi:hypothetical protein
MTQDFGTPVTPPPPPPVEGVPFQAPLPPQKKSNTTLIIVIVVVVLCCCCAVAAGVGYYLYQNGDQLFNITSSLPLALLLH